MVAVPKLVHSVSAGNKLGEGVLWNDETRRVWWTDIEDSLLLEYDLESDTLATWNTPHRVACFGFVKNDARLIVAFDRGIALYDPPSGAIDWLVGPGALAEGLRFNDGKIDPVGRFWVGTMVEDSNAASATGALYSFDPTVGLTEQLSTIAISNGLCWSPDGAVMYHVDSPKCEIRAYRFNPVHGTLSGGDVHVQTAKGVHPDGSAVDSDGGLWNAQWGGGRVVRYSVDGRESLVIAMPVSQPTCVAFGGDGLDLLFVTSARVGLSCTHCDSCDRSAKVGAPCETHIVGRFVIGVPPPPRSRFDSSPVSAVRRHRHQAAPAQ